MYFMSSLDRLLVSCQTLSHGTSNCIQEFRSLSGNSKGLLEKNAGSFRIRFVLCADTWNPSLSK